MNSFSINLTPITEKQLVEIVNIIDWFESKPTGALVREEVEAKVRILFQHEFTIPHGIGQDNVFYRVRPTDTLELFYDIGELKYPPAKYTSAGRMNHNKQPVFYAANNEFTACAETNIYEGDWFHITSFRPKLILNLRCIGDITNLIQGKKLLVPNATYEFAYKHILNGLPETTRQAVCAIDQFIYRWMTSRGSDNYNVTATIANEFMRQNKCDGLLYRSVKFEGGINYAISADVYDRAIGPQEIQFCNSGKVENSNSRRVWVSNTAKVINNTTISWDSNEIVLPSFCP